MGVEKRKGIGAVGSLKELHILLVNIKSMTQSVQNLRKLSLLLCATIWLLSHSAASHHHSGSGSGDYDYHYY